MAITDIENNDLTALAEHKNMVGEGYGYGYNDFLGIGSKKKKVKTIAQGVNVRSKADSNFKKQMIRLYQNIKGNIGIRNASLKAIEQPNGLEATYQAVQTFGSPSNEKSLEKHNIYVSIFTKYFIPSDIQDGADCNALFVVLSELEADAELAEKRASAENRPEMQQAVSIAIAERQNQIKKLISKANCESKREQEEAQKATQETLATLKEATSSSTLGADKTTNYIAYGIGGVVLLIAIVILVRK